MDLNQYRTDDETLIVNHWMRGWAYGFVHKCGRKWAISEKLVGCKGGPLFKTKREALEFVDNFVLEVIPRRCRERAGLED